MPIKKNNAAVATAIQNGLNVRGTAPKAVKTVAKKASPVKVAKKVPAPQQALNRAAATAAKTDPKMAPTGTVKLTSDKPLWADTTDRQAAHRKVVHLVGQPLKGTQSYWAEAKVTIRRFGATAVQKGTWLLAFDIMVGTTETTVFYDSFGAEVLRAKTEDKAKIDRFTYWD